MRSLGISGGGAHLECHAWAFPREAIAAATRTPSQQSPPVSRLLGLVLTPFKATASSVTGIYWRARKSLATNWLQNHRKQRSWPEGIDCKLLIPRGRKEAGAGTRTPDLLITNACHAPTATHLLGVLWTEVDSGGPEGSQFCNRSATTGTSVASLSTPR